MDTAMSIRQQQQMLSERENRQEHAARELGTLNKLEGNPYFARIDFHETGEKRSETIYIGMASFTDKPDHYLIYDWRAPISSIYYNGGIGDVTYMTPDGEQTVNVKLKRQFQIENSKIKTVFDTEEVVGDQMLLDALSNRSDTKMKSIVTTIQKEQTRLSGTQIQNYYLFKVLPDPVKRRRFCNGSPIYFINTVVIFILVRLFCSHLINCLMITLIRCYLNWVNKTWSR